MPNSYPTYNLAVNRATCSLFIERSLAGLAHPCLRCPQRRGMWDKDLGRIAICPCGYKVIDIYQYNQQESW